MNGTTGVTGLAEPTTAELFRNAAEREFSGRSASYARLALAVAEDESLLCRLDALPVAKRQPQLLFGAVRLLGGPVTDVGAFRVWTLRHWSDVSGVMRARRTQTNEAGRCAVLLPVLATLPPPLALIELGASAGLCLQPDRYAYRYESPDGVRTVGASPLVLRCRVSGDVPLPTVIPPVAWRAGLDLNPLDVMSEADADWLSALVWPEHVERAERLRVALDLARRDPPPVRRGDVRSDLAPLIARAPAGATVVVFHSSTLGYLEPPDRAAFATAMSGLQATAGVRWIANEVPGVVPGTAAPGPSNVVCLDGRPVARAEMHGASLSWLRA
jgi:hypothetical protein